MNRILNYLLKPLLYIALLYFTLNYFFDVEFSLKSFFGDNDTIVEEELDNNNKRELSDYEKLELEFKNRVDNLENKLLERGYSKSKKCYNQDENDIYCYTNGKYEVIYDQHSKVSFSKKVLKNKLDDYNSEDDFTYIGELLDYDLSFLSSDVNKLLYFISKNYFDSISININGISMDIDIFSSNLVYEFDTYYNNSYDYYYPLSISTIVYDSNLSISKIAEIRKTLYDIAISNNKKLFSYYDYPYLLFNQDINHICGISINEKDGKNMSSSFCHGGTSNTYFRFENSYKNNEFIKVTIKENFFKDHYLEIINRDLKYIGDKLEKEIILDNEIKDKIINYMSNDHEPLLLTINENVEINIKHQYNYYYLQYNIH